MNLVSSVVLRTIVIMSLISASSVFQLAAQTMAGHQAPIIYKQTITPILVTSDIMGWPVGFENDNWRYFGSVVAGADGSKLLFSACVNNASECRPFLVNPDGTGLEDIEAIFPSDLTSRWWGWGNLRLNDDGSRAYIKAQLNDGKVYIAFYPHGVGDPLWAVDKSWWASSFDWFTLTEDGSKLFVGKWDAGGDVRGLYSADFGLGLSQYVDLDILPCDGSCNNLNFAKFLGNASGGGRAFFSWQSIYHGNVHPDNRSAMWFSNLDGSAQKLTTEDHAWVWDGDWRGVSNSGGTKALYHYIHAVDGPYELDVVDVATGASTAITWTSNANGFQSSITRSGNRVVVRGSRGDFGYHYQTVFDVSHGTSRDTWSYHIPVVERGFSNLTADDRYYYVTNDASLCKVDMRADLAGDFSAAPIINAISFTAPYLWHDASAQIGVTVDVSDSQGLATVVGVRLVVLVEGIEEPEWSMPREPLAFPDGDSGSTILSDDGSNGDVIAGDGVFTFDAIATRKGDTTSFNTWYTHYSLPHDVGIRIIAEDADGNFTIADTTLWITSENSAPPPIFADDFENGTTSAWSFVPP